VTVGIEDAAFVVCGGTTAFGRAVARELVDDGARVLLVGPDLQALDEAVKELGNHALPCVAELADPDDAARVGGVAAALLGGVDGVVLAPAQLPPGDVLDLTSNEWVAALSQSVWGPLGLLRGIVPLLEEGGGTVVYVIPAGTGERDARRVVRAILEALVDELAGMLPPGIRLSRIEADPELAGAVARLLAPQ
jgi:3-oxoacyl-[acyl-carrier protein] reductase